MRPVEAIKVLTDSVTAINRTLRQLDGGPLSHYVEKLNLYITTLFERFAPFRVGDTVVVTDGLRQIADDSGWSSRRHWLKPGALGFVREVDLGKSGFFAYVEFPEETWLDRDGNPQPVDSPALYGLGENEIRRVDDAANREDP